MPCILLPSFAALVACTPSPQEAAMRDPGPLPVTAAPASNETHSEAPGSVPVAKAGDQAAAPLADSPAEAQGRRILSTAFVRLGAGEHITVELRDGRVIVLRDVVMRRRDYCGVQVGGDRSRARYCGGYAEIAAARPGGAPAVDEPGPAGLAPKG
jgi:hypothetical protein